jgi:hypothetical protein
MLKNVNLKEDIVLYSVDRHIRSPNGSVKLGQLTDIELPVQLRPFQRVVFNQNIAVDTKELEQTLGLNISYQRMTQDPKEQNLLIIQASLCAGAQTLVRNVIMSESEAELTYQARH